MTSPLEPARGPGSTQLRQRVERLSFCACGEPLAMRWGEQPPEVAGTAPRGHLVLAFVCPKCKAVNERSTADWLRYARSLGSADAPQMVQELAVLRKSFVARALDANQRPAKVGPDGKAVGGIRDGARYNADPVDAARLGLIAARMIQLYMDLLGLRKPEEGDDDGDGGAGRREADEYRAVQRLLEDPDAVRLASDLARRLADDAGGVRAEAVPGVVDPGSAPGLP